MNIIVIGCGKIGTNIVSSLAEEGHDIVVLDNDPQVITQTTNIYDVYGVCGSGTDCEALHEAGVEKADLVVAVTGLDEFNMLSCFLAKRMGAKHTIARIRNPEYNDQSLAFMRQQLDLSHIINPDLLAAHELYNILKLPCADKIETFSMRRFEMIVLKLKQDSVFDGVKISELRAKYNANFLVCAVQRGDEAYIPDGNFVLKSGDRIGVTAKPSEILKFLKQTGLQKNPARNVMILGGSKTAYYLTKMLTGIGNSVTIIEQDKNTCEMLSELLPKAVIINADGTKLEYLIEDGLTSSDAFVALTGMDEENILISSFAASKGVPKVICKVNSEELAIIAEHCGVDSIISPKKLISDVLIRYARALNNSKNSSVETLYKLMDDKVEALQFNVKSGCSIIGIPFKELKTKSNTLIAGIIRGRKTITPSGEDMLLADDKVIILAANQRINDLTDIVR